MRHLPDVGAEIEALLAPYTQAAYDEARKNGQREHHDAYRADGLHALARGSKTPCAQSRKGASRNDTKTFIHIDLATLLRGRCSRVGLPHRPHRPCRRRLGEVHPR